MHNRLDLCITRPEILQYENERNTHEHLCAIGIPVGTKVVYSHCNVHFAGYASSIAT
jgi:hypothetical protein